MSLIRSNPRVTVLVCASFFSFSARLQAEPVFFTYQVTLATASVGPPDAQVTFTPAPASGPIDVLTEPLVDILTLGVAAGGGNAVFNSTWHIAWIRITDTASGEFFNDIIILELSGSISGSSWSLQDVPDGNYYSRSAVLGGIEYRWQLLSSLCNELTLNSPQSSAVHQLKVTASFPDVTGACCFPDQTCEVRTQDACRGLVYMGYGTDCGSAVCEPYIACCVFDMGCLTVSQEECALLDGIEFEWFSPGCTDFDHACHPDFPPHLVAAPAPFNRQRTRYVSFYLEWGYWMAMKIRRTAPLPAIDLGWLDLPDVDGFSRIVDQPVFEYWPTTFPAGRTIHLSGCPITPGSTYEIMPTQSSCLGWGPYVFSTVPKPSGKDWGDLVGPFNGTDWPAPDGFANVNDILAVLAYIRGTGIFPDFTVVNVQAQSSNDPCLNDFVNVADLFGIVRAVGGAAYPFTTDPTQCPPCP